MTNLQPNKKPSKTQGIYTLRRVALGHFIIFHARTRMGINKSTQRNPAHESIFKLVEQLNFVVGDGLQNAILNRCSAGAYRPLKNDAKHCISSFESAADLNGSDHDAVSVLLSRTHPSHLLASLLTSFALNRLRLRLTRTEHRVRSLAYFAKDRVTGPTVAKRKAAKLADSIGTSGESPSPEGRGNGRQLRQSFIFWSVFQTRRQLSNEMQRKNQFAKAIAMLMAKGIEKVF